MLMCNYAHLVNVLGPHIRRHRVERVLEIGSGAGYLALLLHQLLGTRAILVDLAEMLPLAFTVLSHYEPNARIVLPHEADMLTLESAEADFILLTPDQADRLGAQSVDLAINTSSFQEMTYPVISRYFAFIDRSVRDGGLFYCMNQIECRKVPGSPISFERYPWNRQRASLVDEEYAYWRFVGEGLHWQRLQVMDGKSSSLATCEPIDELQRNHESA